MPDASIDPQDSVPDPDYCCSAGIDDYAWHQTQSQPGKRRIHLVIHRRGTSFPCLGGLIPLGMLPVALLIVLRRKIFQ